MISDKRNPKQRSPENLKKKKKLKFSLMIGSNVFKNKFRTDHIIFEQYVTEVSVGVLSVIFPLKNIINLKRLYASNNFRYKLSI